QVSMKAIIPLLFILFFCESSAEIDWKDCDISALCLVHYSCNNEQKKTKYDLVQWPKSTENRACKIGIQFKPASTKE
ncbi:hypothetical protein PMAYCL1PPCAC_26606, partial [Pristionchus mayeri]